MAKRKKYQRRFNRLARAINKNIQDDWLWNGRFVLRQKAAYFHEYEDHSGAMFDVLYELKDQKTGKVKQAWFDNYGVEWRLWSWVNTCICDYWDVWSEDPDPREVAFTEGRRP